MSAYRSTSPHRNSARAAAIVWASSSANSTATRWPRCCSTGCARYPILSIEDPFAEDDDKGFEHFTAAVGDRIQVIGDDYLVTSASRVREAARRRSVNAVLIKVNQAGTVSEAKAALDEGRRAGFGTIVSARSGETEDTSIVHLAIGWGAGQLKVGSFARSERMAKWNEALRIEEALGSKARFAGLDEMPMRRQAAKSVEAASGGRA